MYFRRFPFRLGFPPQERLSFLDRFRERLLEQRKRTLGPFYNVLSYELGVQQVDIPPGSTDADLYNRMAYQMARGSQEGERLGMGLPILTPLLQKQLQQEGLVYGRMQAQYEQARQDAERRMARRVNDAAAMQEGEYGAVQSGLQLTPDALLAYDWNRMASQGERSLQRRRLSPLVPRQLGERGRSRQLVPVEIERDEMVVEEGDVSLPAQGGALHNQPNPRSPTGTGEFRLLPRGVSIIPRTHFLRAMGLLDNVDYDKKLKDEEFRKLINALPKEETGRYPLGIAKLLPLLDKKMMALDDKLGRLFHKVAPNLFPSPSSATTPAPSTTPTTPAAPVPAAPTAPTVPTSAVPVAPADGAVPADTSPTAALMMRRRYPFNLSLPPGSAGPAPQPPNTQMTPQQPSDQAAPSLVPPSQVTASPVGDNKQKLATMKDSALQLAAGTHPLVVAATAGALTADRVLANQAANQMSGLGQGLAAMGADAQYADTSPWSNVDYMMARGTRRLAPQPQGMEGMVQKKEEGVEDLQERVLSSLGLFDLEQQEQQAEEEEDEFMDDLFFYYDDDWDEMEEELEEPEEEEEEDEEQEEGEIEQMGEGTSSLKSPWSSVDPAYKPRRRFETLLGTTSGYLPSELSAAEPHHAMFDKYWWEVAMKNPALVTPAKGRDLYADMFSHFFGATDAARNVYHWGGDYEAYLRAFEENQRSWAQRLNQDLFGGKEVIKPVPPGYYKTLDQFLAAYGNDPYTMYRREGVDDRGVPLTPLMPEWKLYLQAYQRYQNQQKPTAPDRDSLRFTPPEDAPPPSWIDPDSLKFVPPDVPPPPEEPYTPKPNEPSKLELGPPPQEYMEVLLPPEPETELVPNKPPTTPPQTHTETTQEEKVKERKFRLPRIRLPILPIYRPPDTAPPLLTAPEKVDPLRIRLEEKNVDNTDLNRALQLQRLQSRNVAQMAASRGGNAGLAALGDTLLQMSSGTAALEIEKARRLQQVKDMNVDIRNQERLKNLELLQRAQDYNLASRANAEAENLLARRDYFERYNRDRQQALHNMYDRYNFARQRRMDREEDLLRQVMYQRMGLGDMTHINFELPTKRTIKTTTKTTTIGPQDVTAPVPFTVDMSKVPGYGYPLVLSPDELVRRGYMNKVVKVSNRLVPPPRTTLQVPIPPTPLPPLTPTPFPRDPNTFAPSFVPLSYGGIMDSLK